MPGGDWAGISPGSDLEARGAADRDAFPEVVEASRELLAERLRKSCWIIIAALVLFAVLDPLLRPELVAPLYLIKILGVLAAGLTLVALRSGRSRGAVIAAGLFAFAVACVVPAVSSIYTVDTTTTMALCIAMAFGAATFVPWGLGPQIVAAAIALAASFLSAWVVHGTVMHTNEYPVLALIIALAGSAYIVRENDRHRRALARASAERRRAEDQLGQALEEMQDLWNNAPCGYHSVDSEGVFLRINDTELVWLGYSREEVVGRLRFPDLLTAEGAKTFETAFPLVKERGWVRDVEYDMVCKDGSILPVMLSSSSVIDVDGEFVMSRSTIIDNRARKEFERQKADFFSMVAHDIRNPLTTMVTGLELLDDDPDLPPEARETVAAVQRSAGTLSTMVNDYLDYAKIEAGLIQIHRRPVPVAPFLEQVCADVRHDASKRGIDLRLEVDADPGVVDVDPMALLRVLSNLLGNALKFTPPGGCITLRAERRDGSLVLAVSDTGPGVAAEEIPALFARYGQTASGRKKLGTGLGLFVVKSLTEAHGGSVTVDSEVGTGTTFRIVLPAAAAQEKAA